MKHAVENLIVNLKRDYSLRCSFIRSIHLYQYYPCWLGWVSVFVESFSSCSMLSELCIDLTHSHPFRCSTTISTNVLQRFSRFSSVEWRSSHVTFQIMKSEHWMNKISLVGSLIDGWSSRKVATAKFTIVKSFIANVWNS